MADRIEANYEMLEQIAMKFTQQGTMFEETLQKIIADRNDLEGEWIGQSYNAFAQEMDDFIIPVCRRLIQALHESSDTTKSIMNTMREAEEEAANRFLVLA